MTPTTPLVTPRRAHWLAAAAALITLTAAGVASADAGPRGPRPVSELPDCDWYVTAQIERAISGTYALRVERVVSDRWAAAAALTLGSLREAQAWESVQRRGLSLQGVLRLAGRFRYGLHLQLKARLVHVHAEGRAEMVSDVWHSHMTAVVRGRYVTRGRLVVSLGFGGGACVQRGEVHSPVETREVRDLAACLDADVGIGFAF